MKLKYQGRIEKGKLVIYDRQGLVEDLSKLEDIECNIVIEERKRKRSNNQNAYLWSVVYPCIRKGLLDLGHVLNLEEVHEFCKNKFNSKELIDESTGVVLGTYVESTTKLDTFDFNEYFEAIIRWGAEYLSIQIPYPNEQVSLNF